MIKSSRLFCWFLCVLSTHAWADDAHRIDIIFDTSGSMRVAKQPLISTVQTLAWSLVLAAQKDQIADVALTLTGFCEDAEQVKVAGSDVFDATQWPTAANALSELGRGCRGKEDGWNALDHALRARPESQPGHLLLITDEPRSKVNDEIDQMEMLQSLYKRQIVLDAMVAVEIRCGDGRRALGLTDKGIGYVMTESGAFDLCTDARIHSAMGTTVSDYASVALASGGSVWNVVSLRQSDHRESRTQAIIEAIAQGYTSAVLNRSRWADKQPESMARPSASSMRVAVGEPISMDGQASIASRSDLTVFEWQWDIDSDGSFDYYGPDTYHVFHTPGYHPITLSVVDTDGKRDNAMLLIDVYDPAAQPVIGQ